MLTSRSGLEIHFQVDFPATVKSKVIYDRDKNIYRTGDSLIHVTSDIPVTILQNNYIMDNLTGDTFLGTVTFFVIG